MLESCCGGGLQCVREPSLTHCKLRAQKAFWVFKQNSVKTLKIEKLHLKCDHFLGSYYQTIIPGVVSLVFERVNLT